MAFPAQALILLVTLATLGCGEDFSVPDADCTPLYAPTWSNVHTETLAKSCAVSGGCHSAPGALGLVLSNPTQAHAALLETLVSPGFPKNSELMYRLSPEAGLDQMPPGKILQASERCSISLWIRQGANP